MIHILSSYILFSIAPCNLGVGWRGKRYGVIGVHNIFLKNFIAYWRSMRERPKFPGHLGWVLGILDQQNSISAPLKKVPTPLSIVPARVLYKFWSLLTLFQKPMALPEISGLCVMDSFSERYCVMEIHNASSKTFCLSIKVAHLRNWFLN